MEYTYVCQHCSANLDEGDIFEHFFLEYRDFTKAMTSARHYGWSETNQIHFNRAIIIQSETCPQYTICPDCEQIDPFLELTTVAKK